MLAESTVWEKSNENLEEIWIVVIIVQILGDPHNQTVYAKCPDYLCRY